MLILRPHDVLICNYHVLAFRNPVSRVSLFFKKVSSERHTRTRTTSATTTRNSATQRSRRSVRDSGRRD